ncbi:hypothetical protein Ndes2437A_g04865 [Nannochloris sp. 'desiccata']
MAIGSRAPYSRGIRVEDLQRYICDLWRPLMAGIDAYSPPEKCSGPGRPKRHDHSGITLKIVKVALGNKFSIDEAEFLLAKMDSNPDFAGLTWFTPAKTIRNRTKATILYNAYHDPALPLPEKIKPAKRAPAGHTWESAYPAHPNWDQHVHIIAKSIMAVEATMATDGEIFNAIEMACKAVALWDTIHPDEFAEYMKKKGKTKNKRKRAREAQGSENAVSVPVPAPATEATTVAQRRQRRSRTSSTPTPRTMNQNLGTITSSYGLELTPTNQLLHNGFASAMPIAVSAVAPAAPAPAPAAAMDFLSLGSRSLYSYYRYQAHGSDIPRYTYEERHNGHVHQHMPAVLEQALQQPLPEEDSQQEVSLSPDHFPNIDGLDFDDIFNADILDSY